MNLAERAAQTEGGMPPWLVGDGSPDAWYPAHKIAVALGVIGLLVALVWAVPQAGHRSAHPFQRVTAAAPAATPAGVPLESVPSSSARVVPGGITSLGGPTAAQVCTPRATRVATQLSWGLREVSAGLYECYTATRAALVTVHDEGGQWIAQPAD